MKSPNPMTLFYRVGATSLAALPLVLIVSFILHFFGEFTPSDFLVLRLRYQQPPAERFMELFQSDDIVAFVLPHLLIYLALPLMIPAAAYLAALLLGKHPRLAIAGVTLTSFGVVFMGGVFGSWLSFTAVGNVADVEIATSVSALRTLISNNSMLTMTSMLAAPSMIGVLVLTAGLFSSRILPRHEAALIFAGTLLIVVFMDIDNLMLVGSVLFFAGAFPSFRRQMAAEPGPGPLCPRSHPV